MSKKYWDVYWRHGGTREQRRHTARDIVVLEDEHTAQVIISNWTGGMENVYRVRIDMMTNRAEVACLGMEATDGMEEGIYDDASKLPMWIQERVAVLSMMKVSPPQTKVEGIGMRVSEDVFWVLKGD